MRVNKGHSLTPRPTHEKIPGKDIAREPAMKELKRMIRSGELDQDRTMDYLREDEADEPSEGRK